MYDNPYEVMAMKIAYKCIIVAAVMCSVVHACADSLWTPSESGQVESLFSDQKACKVGDIITVLIVESSVSSQNANSSRTRKSNFTGAVSSWNRFKIHDWEPQTVAQGTPLPAWEADTSNKLSGGGTFTGNYNLRAQITTRIIEVLPNKNVLIEGTSEVFINKEKNMVEVSGIARPEDITVANTVLSTQLADARIKVVGKGPLNDKTNRGFIEVLTDLFWPF
jgi:flagellar L-ring protein FlgH